MNTGRSLIALTVAIAVIGVGGERAGAQSPGRCVKYSPLGYCLEWEVPSAGTPVRPVKSGGAEPTCYWSNLDNDIGASDPTVFVDYGLEQPPDGTRVVWQEWVCSDGSTTDSYRWIVPVDPAAIATSVRGRIAGRLPQPAVASSPAPGVAAIIDIPVFVEVTNWTGVVTDGDCAGGICVTVTATPALTFHPGEPSAHAVACAGRGTRYEPDGPDPEAQASAPGACSHDYSLRTGAVGRPSAWDGSASVTWSIAWTASTGASGSLPSVTRATPVPRAVQEVQVVVTGGQTP